MRYSELIENTDDDDLFGGSDRGSPTPEQAIAKFKISFPVNKRVSWSKMHFGTVERLFDLTADQRFRAGESYSRSSYWSTQALTNRQAGLGMLIYEDSGGGTWVYLGANDREDFARMIQQLIAADQLEDPEAAKQRRLEKQQRRAAAAEKKGIRVGAKIRVPSTIGQTATAEVVSISKAGKLNLRMIDGPDAGQLHSWQPSAHSVRKADVIGESDDDDDMFATPKIAFNDLFNEYDEDELMAQGFQYGDHPEQDIEILNDYLEGYRDFRVVGLSGGEHDLVLHLDRSSKLKETNDDELFGADSVRDKISQRLHKLYKQILYEADDLGYDAIFNHCKQFAKMWDRYDDQLSEDPIEDMAMKEPVNRLSAAIVELEKVAADPYEYIYENTDDELFGSPALTAAKIGKLLGAAGITSGEIVDPESVNMALHRIAALDKYRVKAEIMQQQWLNMDEDTAWNMVDDIANVVYDINGDGWEPEDTIYNESDDELFGKKWYERIDMSSIELDGIDHRDSPDFSDAHVSYAEFDDGKPLSNKQLEWLTNELGSTGKLHELVWDSLHEDGHAL